MELEGVAEGSGLKLDEIMLIAAFNEVFYPKLAKACTSFAVRNGADVRRTYVCRSE